MEFKEYIEGNVYVIEDVRQRAGAILKDDEEISDNEDWEEVETISRWFECNLCGEEIGKNSWTAIGIDDELKNHFREHHQ